jgi:hypothetical protein
MVHEALQVLRARCGGAQSVEDGALLAMMAQAYLGSLDADEAPSPDRSRFVVVKGSPEPVDAEGEPADPIERGGGVRRRGGRPERWTDPGSRDPNHPARDPTRRVPPRRPAVPRPWVHESAVARPAPRPTPQGRGRPRREQPGDAVQRASPDGPRRPARGGGRCEWVPVRAPERVTPAVRSEGSGGRPRPRRYPRPRPDDRGQVGLPLRPKQPRPMNPKPTAREAGTYSERSDPRCAQHRHGASADLRSASKSPRSPSPLLKLSERL